MLLNANSRARPNHARANRDRACHLLETVYSNLLGVGETTNPVSDRAVCTACTFYVQSKSTPVSVLFPASIVLSDNSDWQMV